MIPGSFAVSGGAVAFIHSQTANYIVHLIAVATTATTFASPYLPFIHCPHVRTLPNSHLPTHTLRTLHTHTPHAPPYS